MTTIYLMRHSESLKTNNINNNDSLQVQNEKNILTINGENLAKEKSKEKELQDIDIVISSNYVRAIATAKYFSNEINIDESFGERKYGIKDKNELPENFEYKQWTDLNYKIGDGESIKEVIERETKALNRILNEYENKKILIIGHSTAIAALLSNWCELSFDKGYKFEENIFFDGKWDYCETFKLVFDQNKDLIDIKNI